MKNFFKYLLASVLGVLIANVILSIFTMFFLFAILGSMGSSMSGSMISVKKNSILQLTLEDYMPDRASENPLDGFNLFNFSARKQTGLNQILSVIAHASVDKNIAGIYLDLQDITSNFGAMASIEEIRRALEDFKESGKFIYSYSNMGYSQKSYYLATVADSVFVNPEAPLLLYGMSSNVAFYKETLEKIGIQPEVIRVGKFKSAVEPFLDNRMSDANREQLQTYMNSMWGTLVDGISESREISIDKINELTDNFRFYTPEEFASFGFFDGVIFEDQMLEKLRSSVNAKDKPNIVPYDDYVFSLEAFKNSASDKIAVIYAEGEIGMEQSSSVIGPELAQTIREAREDNETKAIVLRVNSPGGSALTSDIIWREVQLASENKPVIVSMGNVAASGGYYIACAASKILAEPTTLTGSIGVFGLMFSGEKLIKEKIGLHVETVKTNEHSDFGGSYPLMLPIADRPLSTYEKEVMQQYVNGTYDTFLTRVSEGRSMSKEAVNEIGQGRVWTGKDALRIGLVDQLGGLNDAILLAAEEAKLEHYTIEELPSRKFGWMSSLFNLSAHIKTNMLKKELGVYYETYQQLKHLNTLQNGVMARIPYDLTVN